MKNFGQIANIKCEELGGENIKLEKLVFKKTLAPETRKGR